MLTLNNTFYVRLMPSAAVFSISLFVARIRMQVNSFEVLVLCQFDFDTLSRATRCDACHTSHLQRLTIRLQQPESGHGRWHGSTGSEADADGSRDSPREVGARLDIRVYARAERRDGDGHSRGGESVAVTVTVEPVSGGPARGNDTHSTVTVGGGAGVPCIPEVVSERSGVATSRQHRISRPVHDFGHLRCPALDERFPLERAGHAVDSRSQGEHGSEPVCAGRHPDTGKVHRDPGACVDRWHHERGGGSKSTPTPGCPLTQAPSAPSAFCPRPSAPRPSAARPAHPRTGCWCRCSCSAPRPAGSRPCCRGLPWTG